MSSTESTERAPRLLVFAGPNGSGKSSITVKVPVVGIYVNAGDIKRIRGCSDLAAAQEAEQIRRILLAARKDLTFETVLSTARNLDFLRQAKQVGYAIQAVFVLTKDPAINVARVRQRVAAGGHGVPEEKIISRYQKSLGNLSELVRIADRTRVIDNTGELPELICEVEQDRVRILENIYWRKEEILALLARKSLPDGAAR